MMLRGFAVGVFASVTVGPVAVLCIQRALSKPWRVGFFSGLGVALADTLMAIVAFFFYSMLESKIVLYSDILHLFGGLFVIIVGIFIFFKKPVPQLRRNISDKSAKRVDSTVLKDMFSIMGFTLANFVVVIPYLLAFFAMFGVGTVTSAGGVTDLVTFLQSSHIIVGFLCGAVAWWTVLTFVVSLFRRRFHPEHLHALNRISGVVIVILGIITILSLYISWPHASV